MTAVAKDRSNFRIRDLLTVTTTCRTCGSGFVDDNAVLRSREIGEWAGHSQSDRRRARADPRSALCPIPHIHAPPQAPKGTHIATWRHVQPFLSIGFTAFENATQLVKNNVSIMMFRNNNLYCDPSSSPGVEN